MASPVKVECQIVNANIQINRLVIEIFYLIEAEYISIKKVMNIIIKNELKDICVLKEVGTQRPSEIVGVHLNVENIFVQIAEILNRPRFEILSAAFIGANYRIVIVIQIKSSAIKKDHCTIVRTNIEQWFEQLSAQTIQM